MTGVDVLLILRLQRWNDRGHWLARACCGLVLLVSLGGCFSPKPAAGLACSPEGECPPGQLCIANVCVAKDDPDIAPPICEEGVDCTGVCGDVNQDGNFDGTDATDLARVASGEVRPCTCANEDADIDDSGSLDELDATLATAVLANEVTAPCASCDPVCGDADLNGTVEADDATVVDAIAAGVVPTACSYAAADVDRNARIDRYDSALILALVRGRVPSLCTSCSEVSCGDVNGDGTVDANDVNAVSNIAGADSTPICEFVAADLDKSASIDAADVDLVRALIPPATVEPVCEVCTSVCGDANQDGDVSGLDSVTFTNFINASETPDVCGFDAANVRVDGVLTARDANLVQQLILETVTGGCTECTGVCGDVDQDGDVDDADANDASALAMDGPGGGTTACAFDAADIDASGSITIDDANVISQSVANMVIPTCTAW